MYRSARLAEHACAISPRTMDTVLGSYSLMQAAMHAHASTNSTGFQFAIMIFHSNGTQPQHANQKGYLSESLPACLLWPMA